MWLGVDVWQGGGSASQGAYVAGRGRTWQGVGGVNAPQSQQILWLQHMVNERAVCILLESILVVKGDWTLIVHT